VTLRERWWSSAPRTRPAFRDNGDPSRARAVSAPTTCPAPARAADLAGRLDEVAHAVQSALERLPPKVFTGSDPVREVPPSAANREASPSAQNPPASSQ
jgi:hypothetical protein